MPLRMQSVSRRLAAELLLINRKLQNEVTSQSHSIISLQAQLTTATLTIEDLRNRITALESGK